MATVRSTLVAVSWLILPGTAFAAKLDERVDVLENEVRDLSDTSEELERQVNPGRGFLTENDAVVRFQDMVVEYLVGNYEKSAEGFFLLVTTGSLADAGLHRDAEWYLAEALAQLGNVRTAEARYLVIADDAAHPFREDAVRRLLEMYAKFGDSERFTQLYESQILSGRVKPSDLITYTVAKSFWLQKNNVKAKSHLGEIPAGSAMYGKSRYFLGAIAVQEANVENALPYFQEVAALSIASSEDRLVQDSALLAMGRIYLELKRFDDAADAYGRIGGDSEVKSDQLYEQVWTCIKQKDVVRDTLQSEEAAKTLTPEKRSEYVAREKELTQAALRAVDLFLLQFPEHEYTGLLQLIRGHLHLQAIEYDSALTSYEQVITDYTPIKARFGELARSSETPDVYFQRVRALQGGDTTEAQIPKYALAKMMADPDLSRSLTVYNELEHQEETIKASEAIIAELEPALGSGVVGGFEQIKYRLHSNRFVAVQKEMELLSIEEEWLAITAGADLKRDLDNLRARRETLEGQILAGASSENPPDLSGDALSLARDYRDVRTKAKVDAVFAARLDVVHNSVEHALNVMTTTEGKLGTVQEGEVANIRKRFQDEVVAVAAEREDWKRTLAEAETVSVGLTREGFGRLEDFFSQSVLRADVGVVDVYWAQKVEVSNELERVTKERNDLRGDLLARFARIEQKLGE